ncbi:MAG: ABC transporter permease [Propionibacteriaceae bacterium]|jgi:peptide/nickel transport system permease protein|nr:ABC transporter permease [Propionibacteriaceae bacterium]
MTALTGPTTAGREADRRPPATTTDPTYATSGPAADRPTALDSPAPDALQPASPSSPAAAPADDRPARAGRARRRPTLVVGAVLVGLGLLVAVVSLFWTPYNLTDTAGGRLEAPSLDHWLGTDKLGRDTASFVMVGTRIALQVGLGAAGIAALAGTAVGLAAAWAKPWLDDAAASVFDVMLAFPTLLLAMVIGAAQGRSTATVIIAIGLAQSAYVARLSRILARRVRGQAFVTAAIVSGSSLWAITFRHLLPNMWTMLVVNFALSFGVGVLAEATLSYLGLGVPPPNASLGRLMKEAQQTVLTAPVEAIAPGVMVLVLVIGANYLADGLRELADPVARGRA